MSVHNLPCEMLRSIFEKVDSQDVPQLRQVCRTFNNVIANNNTFLPRMAHVCWVEMENGQLYLTHMKSGSRSSQKRNIKDFDFSYWREIAIVEMKFCNIENGENVADSLEMLTQNFLWTRQHELRLLRFSSVNLDQTCASSISQFFERALRSCEDVFVENSSLPIIIENKSIFSSKFDHFRWENSTLACETPSDAILQKLQRDMRGAFNKRSFLAQLDSVGVETVCDFIQAWLHLPRASFFNLTFNNCDDLWKEKFTAECEKRRLTHEYLEFQSKAHNNAHIKVNFSQDSTTCCIWPIVDIPARATGKFVCYSRYFRDF